MEKKTNFKGKNTLQYNTEGASPRQVHCHMNEASCESPVGPRDNKVSHVHSNIC